ncbi:MAG: bacteriohopanetetrol glucosamine biosynthesis glycosyltransferase HpnI [Acidithiobacillus sp.]|uniref:bacteriohopanetetrol glucosamine biosynthesis glycosyltransferase HpnI n=1 Tax=Acidithiobacillus sp. TaxID=1872118 RepID=UPI003CFFB51E
MTALIPWWHWLAWLLCAAALAYLAFALWALARWRPRLVDTYLSDQRSASPQRETDKDWPAVSLLKPLHGLESGLYDNLRSFCSQDYPCYEIVFGVQDPADPAIAVVERLRREYPDLRIALSISAAKVGSNPKVNNLAGILALCRHDYLVISDADIRVGSDYLREICRPLQDDGVGVVTCLYRGIPVAGFWSWILAAQINESFLPSVLVAARLGPTIYCGGATMALRRGTLEGIGGWAALGAHLADDYRLGALSRARGKRTLLSTYVVDTMVHELDFSSFYQHALRWSRTTRVVQPVGHTLAFISYPLPVVALLAPGAGGPGLVFLVVVLGLRLVYHYAILKKLRITNSEGVLDAFLADGMGLLIWFHALFARRIRWRGDRFAIDPKGRMGGHDGAQQ